MRIIVVTNAPWAASAYAKMGKYLSSGLTRIGHEVFYVTNWGLQGGVLELDEYPIYPLGLDSWCNDIIEQYVYELKADVVISIIDLFVLDRWNQRLGEKWIPWFPLDGCPAPKSMLKQLAGTKIAATYSKFAEAELKRLGVNNIVYVPVGVDTSIFKPRPGRSFDEIRRNTKRELGIDPDKFLAVMVAANQSYPDRKAFVENIEAFARFHKKYPNSLFYIHTWPLPNRGGVDLYSICELLGTEKSVVFPPTYGYHLGFTEERMAAILNAADVYMGATAGEGFNVPLVEAQACGVPVIVCNNTSGPELCGSGWVVPWHHRTWYPLGVWHHRPDIGGIYNALKQAYKLRYSDRYDEACLKAVEFASQFEWKKVIDQYWKVLLETFEEDSRLATFKEQPAESSDQEIRQELSGRSNQGVPSPQVRSS